MYGEDRRRGKGPRATGTGEACNHVVSWRVGSVDRRPPPLYLVFRALEGHVDLLSQPIRSALFRTNWLCLLLAPPPSHVNISPSLFSIFIHHVHHDGLRTFRVGSNTSLPSSSLCMLHAGPGEGEPGVPDFSIHRHLDSSLPPGAALFVQVGSLYLFGRIAGDEFAHACSHHPTLCGPRLNNSRVSIAATRHGIASRPHLDASKCIDGLPPHIQHIRRARTPAPRRRRTPPSPSAAPISRPRPGLRADAAACFVRWWRAGGVDRNAHHHAHHRAHVHPALHCAHHPPSSSSSSQSQS
ncbi:hypothetical protein B0H12DRAFT_207543 [Mycena haematopus]|nr:hypothetical protein B0H12DRAFT_207543 [Mycena haematopus]